jgi:DNA-binding MarR family transcriptional regulator
MESRGQLVKEGCPTDARGWFAVLTPSGLEDIRRAAPHHVASVRRNLLDALDRAQMTQITAIASVIRTHLAAAPCCGDEGAPGVACGTNDEGGDAVACRPDE